MEVAIQYPNEALPETSTITPNCFDRAAGQGLLASRQFGFVFGLFADVGIGVLERAGKVVGRGFAADITVDA